MYSDLYYCLPWSHGSLGFLVGLELQVNCRLCFHWVLFATQQCAVCSAWHCTTVCEMIFFNFLNDF